jgi:PHD/YefM family antitoxin component YafN of YafNO toxin-antitoxin module
MSTKTDTLTQIEALITADRIKRDAKINQSISLLRDNLAEVALEVGRIQQPTAIMDRVESLIVKVTALSNEMYQNNKKTTDLMRSLKEELEKLIADRSTREAIETETLELIKKELA